MSDKSSLVQNIGLKRNEQVHRRDEQIRRIFSAAQYKKYKEAEKAFKSAVRGDDQPIVTSPSLKS
jgi:hypothetical protein